MLTTVDETVPDCDRKFLQKLAFPDVGTSP